MPANTSAASRHLRHPLRRHEAPTLRSRDDPAAVSRSTNAILLRVGTIACLVLQAVARADLDDRDACWAACAIIRAPARLTPGCTSSPGLQCTRRTTPSRGARIGSSIFIASSISSVSPLSRAAPGSTSTLDDGRRHRRASCRCAAAGAPARSALPTGSSRATWPVRRRPSGRRGGPATATRQRVRAVADAYSLAVARRRAVVDGRALDRHASSCERDRTDRVRGARVPGVPGVPRCSTCQRPSALIVMRDRGSDAASGSSSVADAARSASPSASRNAGIDVAGDEPRMPEDGEQERDVGANAEHDEFAQRRDRARAMAASRVSACTISLASSGS